MNDLFEQYQTDILFLLVGSNPLPNYVAARLLAKEQGTLVLLESTATARVAERLRRRLAKDQPDLTFQVYMIPEADGPEVARQVINATRDFERSYPRCSVGLNYTGGTKPMAAYSYRTLSQMFPAGVFSYLDARTLSMVIDPGGGAVQRIPVERRVPMKLADIVDLHGYRITRAMSWPELERQPRRLELARSITEIHLTIDGMEQWRQWMETWRDGASLPDYTQFPALSSMADIFARVCAGTASEAGVAQAVGFQELKQCGKYFVGGWLEDHVLSMLDLASRRTTLDDYAASLLMRHSNRPEFDLDVAATIGYQLFAVSCRATKTKGLAKEHLLEVYTRAGQLGGDEARFAAVTLCDDKNVKELERDVSEEWDAAGKIRVFGRSHIPNLSAHLIKWFREANQEAS